MRPLLPRTAPKPGQNDTPALNRWVVATIIGVVVSLAASLVLGAIGLARIHALLPMLLGLLLGSFIAGRYVGAQRLGQWAAAAGLVALGLLVLGLALLYGMFR